MKLVFLGYMASGKSAVASDFSTLLNLEFIDLDAYIEKQEGASISEIFASKGEVYFRKKENHYLIDLLDQDRSFILSVGGGTPCFTGNMKIIQEKAISVYLKASIQTIYKRIVNEKSKRPLVAEIPDQDLEEFIAKHLFERAPYYKKASYTVNVDDKSIKDLSKEISELMAR